VHKFDKFVVWLASARILAPLRRRVGTLITRVVDSKNGVIVYYNEPDRSKVMNLVREIRNETEMLITNNEAYQIFTVVKGTAKVRGDIAEVGVYKGGSAKLICEAKGSRTLHLFDTFEGFPSPCETDDQLQTYAGRFCASFEDAKDYLGRYPNVYFYKGLFPTSAESLKDKIFSFVHLDVDFFESTLDGLKYFYPRMSQGGIIMCHDYMTYHGVRKAIDEFFQDKPETIIELPGADQRLVVKL
jgi:hypothetical protein